MKFTKDDKKNLHICIWIVLGLTFFLFVGIALYAFDFPIAVVIVLLIAVVAVCGISVMRLKISLDAAKKSIQAKDRFIAHVSHEIRTSISVILGISEIELQQPDLRLRTEESLTKINDSANVLLSIVNDILDLSKIEAGKMLVRNNVYEIPMLVNEISQLYLVYGSKQVEFKLLLGKDLPERLLGDGLRIKQIINNLLSNAFKYTEAGMVILEIDIKKTSVNSLNLIIIVKDTGLGMTPKQVEKLNSEYSRFHEQQSTATGTGLGMSIVYSLVQMMDATIDISSKTRQGTTVTVRIPQTRVDEHILNDDMVRSLEMFEFGLPSTKKLKLVSESRQQGRVLVVDDVDANLYVAQGLLMLYGLKVETCTGGRQAIEKVAEGNVYDIIFMDQTMPEMDGTQAMQTLRDMGYGYPIVVLTANALSGQSEQFLERGFDGFISKPIDNSDLNTILMKYIKNKARTTESQFADDINSFLTSPETVKKLRSDFGRAQSDTIANIEDALKNSDVITAHRLTHSLKSLSALINEHKLVELAHALEINLLDERMLASDVLTDILNELKQELNRVLRAIGRGD